MKKSRWVQLAVIIMATVLLSGCVVEGFGHDHDRGEGHEHDHGDHEGER